MNTLDRIRHYLDSGRRTEAVERVEFLAAGEYNENYLVYTRSGRYVFRINHGSQLDLDNQIEYEYEVLKAVEPSGVTPRIFFVDVDTDGLGNGVLLMEYLEGRPLDYPIDIQRAAEVFARVHSLPAAEGLIVQNNPIEAIAEESYGLINRFPDHPLIGEKVHLLRYHEKIGILAENTCDLFSNEALCIVNTEVNSRNFIVQPERTFLVDWEKAVVSYRYQDLGHFLVPTTTLWKSDYVYSEEEKLEFIQYYAQSLRLNLDVKELFEKTKILERTILLRALSWCFMAYYEYTQTGRTLRNEDTFGKIRDYLNDIESLLAW
ncbi:MAG: aminoglycoside phosphotransferase family protein [Spirochaetaceae bacterium]|nr:MAG: aminoglycoside phosphotransferase family protein [Spirochaetaceae bacterium]